MNVCYAVAISPLGFKTPVLLYFASAPRKADAIAALTGMIAAGHESGPQYLARCIEAVDQHGLPSTDDVDNGRAAFRWKVPGPPENRYGWINVTLFELIDNAPAAASPQPSPLSTGERDATALAPWVPVSEVRADHELPPAPRPTLADVKIRCRVILESAAAERAAYGADLLAKLLVELTCPR